MRKTLLVGSLAAVMLVTGCANMNDTQRRTATGAGVGALGGAAVGAMTGGHAGTGAVIGAGVGALGTYIWSQHMERQKQQMEAATQGTGVVVTQTQDNQLKLDIPSDISFATNRSDIQSNFQPILEKFAESLRNNPDTDVRIVGHTDSTGSDHNCHRLSLDEIHWCGEYEAAGMACGIVTCEPPAVTRTATASHCHQRAFDPLRYSPGC